MMTWAFWKQLANNIAIAGLVGLTVWVMIYLLAASVARDAPVGFQRWIELGPLTLGLLQKLPVDGEPGAYMVDINLGRGTMFYFIGWLLLGVAASLVSLRYQRKRKGQAA